MISRRAVLALMAQAPLMGAMASHVFAADKIDMDKLLALKTLDDKVLGDAKAKVTIVEYASFTCSHCANFHEKGFAHLKQNYIDKGLVRFIFREFPTDERSMKASILLRCAGGDAYFAFADLIFKNQRTWAFVNDWEAQLQALVRQGGIGEAQYKACTDNKEAFVAISSGARNVSTQFGVNSTPTLFIGGEKHVGSLTPEDLDKVLKPMLGL